MLKSKKITKKYIEKEVEKVTGEKDKNEEGFKVGCILLASLIKGPNEKKIAKFLDYSLIFVDKIGRRLRKNRIWVKDKVGCNWFKKEEGGIAFNLDIATGLGWLERAEEKKKSNSKKSCLNKS